MAHRFFRYQPSVPGEVYHSPHTDSGLRRKITIFGVLYMVAPAGYAIFCHFSDHMSYVLCSLIYSNRRRYFFVVLFFYSSFFDGSTSSVCACLVLTCTLWLHVLHSLRCRSIFFFEGGRLFIVWKMAINHIPLFLWLHFVFFMISTKFSV